MFNDFLFKVYKRDMVATLVSCTFVAVVVCWTQVDRGGWLGLIQSQPVRQIKGWGRHGNAVPHISLRLVGRVVVGG